MSEYLMKIQYDEIRILDDFIITTENVDKVFSDDVICLDVSELDSSISKTFLYLITPIFDYYSANESNLLLICSKLEECIYEWEKIINMLDGKLSTLKKVICIKGIDNKYFINDCFKLYNLGMALVQFKRLDEDIASIVIGGYLPEKKENLYRLIGIQQTITYWNYGLVSVLWDNFGYKYSNKYGFSKLINGYLQNVIQLFKKRYSILADDEYDKLCGDLSKDYADMFYLYSKHEIDLKCNTIRIQFAELAYMYSPFVYESRKKDIGVLFDVMWSILSDGEIARIYIEEYEYKTQKNINDIGRNDHTTRIHIIFSLINEDIYSLRIDMPHKGVDYVHFNLQELKNGYVSDSAMPILSKEKVNEMNKFLGVEMKYFFYEVGEGVWWFRTNYLELIENIEDEDKADYLRQIFEEQKHYELKIENDGYELFNEFKYYLKLYLSECIQCNYQIDIGKEIVIYRCVLWARKMLEYTMPGLETKEFELVIDRYKELIISLLLDYTDGFTEEDWNILGYRDILEYIIDEFWNAKK